jgi:hypothetical protein
MKSFEIKKEERCAFDSSDVEKGIVREEIFFSHLLFYLLHLQFGAFKKKKETLSIYFYALCSALSQNVYSSKFCVCECEYLWPSINIIFLRKTSSFYSTISFNLFFLLLLLLFFFVLKVIYLNFGN